MIITINRQPAWGTMPVGAVCNLPDVLAQPLIDAGQAVPTPGAVVTVDDPFAGVAASIVFSSAALSASAVVKGTAGDPGNFVGILCTSVSGGKVTVRDGGSIAGALIAGLGAGGASGLALTAGQYYSLGAAFYCANGIYLEVNGTGTYVVLYQ